MTMAKPITIDEVAKHSGLPASTLRYYEEKGLIQSIGRRGIRRIFDLNVLQRLALISLGQCCGFSLTEISGMFSASGRPQINRKQLLAKADEIDKNIKQLVVMRDGLRHAADCPAPSHLECPTFQRILSVTYKNQFRRRNTLIETKQ